MPGRLPWVEWSVSLRGREGVRSAWSREKILGRQNNKFMGLKRERLRV